MLQKFILIILIVGWTAIGSTSFAGIIDDMLKIKPSAAETAACEKSSNTPIIKNIEVRKNYTLLLFSCPISKTWIDSVGNATLMAFFKKEWVHSDLLIYKEDFWVNGEKQYHPNMSKTQLVLGKIWKEKRPPRLSLGIVLDDEAYLALIEALQTHHILDYYQLTQLWKNKKDINTAISNGNMVALAVSRGKPVAALKAAAALNMEIDAIPLPPTTADYKRSEQGKIRMAEVEALPFFGYEPPDKKKPFFDSSSKLGPPGTLSKSRRKAECLKSGDKPTIYRILAKASYNHWSGNYMRVHKKRPHIVFGCMGNKIAESPNPTPPYPKNIMFTKDPINGVLSNKVEIYINRRNRSETYQYKEQLTTSQYQQLVDQLIVNEVQFAELLPITHARDTANRCANDIDHFTHESQALDEYIKLCIKDMEFYSNNGFLGQTAEVVTRLIKNKKIVNGLIKDRNLIARSERCNTLKKTSRSKLGKLKNHILTKHIKDCKGLADQLAKGTDEEALSHFKSLGVLSTAHVDSTIQRLEQARKVAQARDLRESQKRNAAARKRRKNSGRSRTNQQQNAASRRACAAMKNDIRRAGGWASYCADRAYREDYNDCKRSIEQMTSECGW